MKTNQKFTDKYGNIYTLECNIHSHLFFSVLYSSGEVKVKTVRKKDVESLNLKQL